MKKQMFRSSLGDMRKIEIYNLDGKEEIPGRKIIFRKSLINDTKMHAIEVASAHKGLVFTCETMG